MNQYKKDDPNSVRALFSSIAKKYDATNLVMSFGLNKYWNKKLIKNSLAAAPKGDLLDLCCGTGEITYTFLKDSSLPKKVHMLDFCGDMLEVAKTRAEKLGYKKKHKLRFIEGDAQQIPLKADSVTGVSIAYGIRNIQNTTKCLKEVYRVLEKGGLCGILELTRPSNSLLRAMHKLYLKVMIPAVGALCTSNKEAYSYLEETIGKFIEPKELAKLMQDVGFKEVKVVPMTFGIANLIVGRK